MRAPEAAEDPRRNHQSRCFEGLLLLMLLLRLSLLCQPFLPGHRLGILFWIYVLFTDVAACLALWSVWPDREAFHFRIPRKSQILVWGFGLGMAASTVNIGLRWWGQGTPPRLGDGWYLQIFCLPIVQFLVAATAEEPLFRGFLWGYLRRLGRPDLLILIIQALLFFLGHAYYAKPGLYANWFSTLLMGLAFGISAWKTRSILPGMIAHALVNGLSQTFL